MDAFPANVPQVPDEVVSGLSCPDCFGVLRVASEGNRGALRFRCRTGHLYSAEEVIVGKERRAEESLWAALKDLDELATFLEQLSARGLAGPHAAAYERRALEARRLGEQIRALIEGNEPIDFGTEDDPNSGGSDG